MPVSRGGEQDEREADTDDYRAAAGVLGNFTSFLRVCAMRYLALQLKGEIPQGQDVPIGSLDAERILAGEARELH